jgi:hypothetical protein
MARWRPPCSLLTVRWRSDGCPRQSLGTKPAQSGRVRNPSPILSLPRSLSRTRWRLEELLAAGDGRRAASLPQASSPFSPPLPFLPRPQHAREQASVDGSTRRLETLWEWRPSGPVAGVREHLEGERAAVNRLGGDALCPLRRWSSSSPCLGLPMRMEIERNGRGLSAALLCRQRR